MGTTNVGDRYRGALLGLAAGDALGTTLEFKAPGAFEPISDMVGGGPFRLQPGQWTDDTSMALCLAESLVRCQGFDPEDQMDRYCRWWREGYMSSTGACFDRPVRAHFIPERIQFFARGTARLLTSVSTRHLR
jgi:ADP-ribosyl-[dinitrogen reductase] hydrolase